MAAKAAKKKMVMQVTDETAYHVLLPLIKAYRENYFTLEETTVFKNFLQKYSKTPASKEDILSFLEQHKGIRRKASAVEFFSSRNL